MVTDSSTIDVRWALFYSLIANISRRVLHNSGFHQDATLLAFQQIAADDGDQVAFGSGEDGIGEELFPTPSVSLYLKAWRFWLEDGLLVVLSIEREDIHSSIATMSRADRIE
jgi:hypothetical protein